MLRTTEMTADKAPPPLPHAIGEKQQGQPDQPEQDKKGLRLEMAHPAHRSHDLREDADNKQIAARNQHRRRTLENGVRRIDIDLGKAAPQVADRDQHATDDQRTAFDLHKGKALRREEQSLTAGVNPCTENHPQADEKKLDPPPHRPDSRSESLLQVGKNQHRRQQDQRAQDSAYLAQRNPRFPRLARSENEKLE